MTFWLLFGTLLLILENYFDIYLEQYGDFSCPMRCNRADTKASKSETQLTDLLAWVFFLLLPCREIGNILRRVDEEKKVSNPMMNVIAIFDFWFWAQDWGWATACEHNNISSYSKQLNTINDFEGTRMSHLAHIIIRIIWFYMMALWFSVLSSPWTCEGVIKHEATKWNWTLN